MLTNSSSQSPLCFISTLSQQRRSASFRFNKIGDKDLRTGNKDHSIDDKNLRIGDKDHSIGDKDHGISNKDYGIRDKDHRIGDKDHFFSLFFLQKKLFFQL